MAAARRLEWAELGGAECLRLGGVDIADRPPALRVFPTETLRRATVGTLPSMAGRVVATDGALWFVPRFPFLDGTSYSAVVDDGDPMSIERPRRIRRGDTEVLAIHPSSAVIPRNLLRIYIWFSAPMSEGATAACVRLIDDVHGAPLPGVLLTMEDELWDRGRQRLTVLLDPARIKRGLVPHEEAGYPLTAGQRVRLVVDRELRDASGARLRAPAERAYDVGPELTGRVDPAAWTIDAASAGSIDPLVVGFDRPLDRALLARCVHVRDGRGVSVDGEVSIGPGETSWRLVPRAPWSAGTHSLDVDAVLEDVAGNSVVRVFDRDLGRRDDDPLDGPPPPRRFEITVTHPTGEGS